MSTEKHTMRVIAGKHRRRLLKNVPSPMTRSTRDRVKETLFNMLTPVEVYSSCLDLFAGSGALGIEALSRGVEHAVFVESQPLAFGILKENIETLALSQQSERYRVDAVDYCRRVKKTFDLILLDPPYQSPYLEQTLEIICQKNMLAPQGLVAVLSTSQQAFAIPGCLITVKQRTMGVTMVTLLKGANT
ncbi:MAG: 16S rRNA (guanine(966)-N(2))-methyltransferase RsmD [Acholeplasmatales bacterium]|nr:MAG: 16S rRNA (guanine(966)-N(2))-methyltransferase RsmD [Acholeplasmatales bacterium]